MCARRFLILIVILILIFVGGALALYQFGDQVLVRMATPKGHFQSPPKGSEPNYSQADSWLAKPSINDDPSAWMPEGIASPIGPKPGATFYVHPTTYLERDRWNAPLDSGGEDSKRARLFVESQASAFNGSSEIWAPKYRQAAYGAFLLKSADARQALDLAYRDVRAAFDAFLAAQPADRPIILAGHSQGSMHLLRLLVERKQALQGRLVAAYLVGWPVSTTADLPTTGLPACGKPAQTGCVLSWQSFGEPANPSLVTSAWVGTKGLTGWQRRRADMLCVDPLTGTRDGVAPSAANKGTLVPDGNFARAMLEPGLVGARCDKGFLQIGGNVPNLGPYVLPGNNYHVYDYALFWGSIRADAEQRVAAWRKH